MTRVPVGERGLQLLSETLTELSASCHRLSFPLGGGKGAFKSIPVHKEKPREQKPSLPQTPMASRLHLRGRIPQMQLPFLGLGWGRERGRGEEGPPTRPTCGVPRTQDPEFLIQLLQMQKR